MTQTSATARKANPTAPRPGKQIITLDFFSKETRHGQQWQSRVGEQNPSAERFRAVLFVVDRECQLKPERDGQKFLCAVPWKWIGFNVAAVTLIHEIVPEAEIPVRLQEAVKQTSAFVDVVKASNRPAPTAPQKVVDVATEVKHETPRLPKNNDSLVIHNDLKVTFRQDERRSELGNKLASVLALSAAVSAPEPLEPKKQKLTREQRRALKAQRDQRSETERELHAAAK